MKELKSIWYVLVGRHFESKQTLDQKFKKAKRKSKKDDLSWFELAILRFFGKIFDSFDNEDSEARLDKSRGVKRLNLTWVVLLIIALVILFISYL